MKSVSQNYDNAKNIFSKFQSIKVLSVNNACGLPGLTKVLLVSTWCFFFVLVSVHPTVYVKSKEKWYFTKKYNPTSWLLMGQA